MERDLGNELGSVCNSTRKSGIYGQGARWSPWAQQRGGRGELNPPHRALAEGQPGAHKAPGRCVCVGVGWRLRNKVQSAG